MSEFHIEVVTVKDVRPHSNANTLDICTVHDGYPVIFKRGDYKEGDMAVYFPVDTVLPDDDPRWEFLGPQRRVRAKRLRGVFSMGMLTPNTEAFALGDDVKDFYKARRWEDVQEEKNAYKGASRTDGLQVSAPTCSLPGVYDIEGYRKYGSLWFSDLEEQVIVTEKIHGQNFSAVYWDGKLHIKSRTRWLAYGDPERESTWSKVAQRYNLEDKLARFPGLVLFGESYGNNADMAYGVERHKTGDALAIFDFWGPLSSGEYGFLSEFDHELKLQQLQLTAAAAPILWAGKLKDMPPTITLAEGLTTIVGTSQTQPKHVREGFVIRPAKERKYEGERVILKMHGEGYLTRKTA